MSPHRKLSYTSSRHPTEVQDIFLGLAFQLSPQPPGDDSEEDPGRELEYTAVLHDGTGIVESETQHLQYYSRGKDNAALILENRRVAEHVIEFIRLTQESQAMDVRVVAVAEPVPNEFRVGHAVEAFPIIWLHLDAIPFFIKPATSIFTTLPAPSTQAGASSAISAAIKHLHPATHSATVAEAAPKDHQVLVDCAGQVRLCGPQQYQQSTSPELWRRFTALSSHLQRNFISIAFFSATPQGGGVALMRHALIRLWRIAGISAKWYVPEGHPTVFDITKRKIHNVLQGVAPPGVEMNEEDKKWFELWTEQNYLSFWSDGALDADVIVIDDPQLAPLIPIIKKNRPAAKIIFRSHIQIQSNLTDDPNTAQYRTWNYLHEFVKQTDLFLAHPVKFFVPKNVQEGKVPVLYMPPATDPLDGLNKPYGHTSVNYFRQVFNTLSHKQCGVTIDWDRGYIIQVARFDPSKGHDLLLAAYLLFRQKLAKLEPPPFDNGPQLIIMGHGSVDDPDGGPIYEMLHSILARDEYELVRNDVSIVRAPPSDSILGCILQGAWVATQLSTREGFEVKVTEAVNKRVPIIASDAGGIPLQIKQGVNGWIVPTGEWEPVADLLFDIFTGRQSVHRDLTPAYAWSNKTDPNSIADAFVRRFNQPVVKVHTDSGATSEDFWTVGNAARWMLLASRLLGLHASEADGEYFELLQSMRVGEPIVDRAIDGGNVWRMVMGEEILQGEGELR